MTRLFFSILALLVIAVTEGAEQRLYLAAGDEISVFSIHAENGNLTPLQSLPLPGAGPFTFSADGKMMYAVSGERKSPTLSTLTVEKTGKLKLDHSASVNLRAGYLKVDSTGGFIAGNHYGPGKVTIWALEDGVYRGKTVQELELEPKAHSAAFSADNRWLLVPATGPNKVFVNRFDAGNRIGPAEFAPSRRGTNWRG